MKNFNYIFSAIGWIGFIITLTIIIAFNKCSKSSENTITKETVINNYYDSSFKIVPQTKYLPGEPIYFQIPNSIDTQKILTAYFAKFPFSRTFENDTIFATILDTISKNNFASTGKFNYKWKIPIKTVESTTITVTTEAAKKIVFFGGMHVNFNQAMFKDFGPDMYLKTKHDQLFGVGYNIRSNEVSFKAAINLNEAFRFKNK